MANLAWQPCFFLPWLIAFEAFDVLYPEWLADTQRENTMDEYGMLLDFIGKAREGMDMNYLLMIVSRQDNGKVKG